MSKIIVVTGASGRLGRYISRRLMEDGYSVRAQVQNREHMLTLPAGTVPYLGDVNNGRVMEKICEGADAVVHFAAIVSEWKNTTEQVLTTNVMGTRTVVDACRDNGVKKMLFPSTLDVYGKARKERLTEASQPKPSDKYGYSKMLAEDVIREESGSVNYTIFRIASAYGPGFEHSFFKIFRLIKDGKAHLVGNGENHLSIIHVDDAASAFLLALKSKTSNRKTYNLSDGGEYTQKYLYELAAEFLNVPKPTKQISTILLNLMAKDRGIDSDEVRFLTSDRIIDISLIKRELGFRPRIRIRDGVGEMVKEFMEKQRYSEMRSII